MKKWLVWLGSSAAVLSLAFAGFWYWINIPPQVEIPMPVMPNPNSYDYFLRAGEAFVRDGEGVDGMTSESSEAKEYPLAAKEAWLKENAEAFQLLREGLKYPVHHPVMRSYETFSPEYSKYRELTRALVVESRARGERGDWDGAVQSLLDDYYFANQVGRGGPLLAHLVSDATQAISLQELGDIIQHTDTATAKRAAGRLEKIYDQRYPAYKSLQEEKWLNIAGMLEVMKNPSQLNSLSWRMGLINLYDIPRSDYPKVFTTSKRELISHLVESMDKVIEDAQRPYVKQRSLPASKNPLVEALLPNYETIRWSWARSDTASVTVMTMYALHAYQLDQGHYPKNLQTLVPGYLEKIPIDPFDGIAPIRYQLEGEEYLLWSIGPDGVDNHGTPITHGSGSMRHRNWFPDSEGDVVAGKNTP